MGIEEITKISMQMAKIDCILLDDSLSISYAGKVKPMVSTANHGRNGIKVYRLLRIETILEASLVSARKHNQRYEEWLAELCHQVTPSSFNPEDGVEIVGYKSILAYRVGLAVERWTDVQVRQEFNRIVHEESEESLAIDGGTYRLASKILIDFFLRETAAISSRSQHPLPIQIHTGFGDSDLRLELANPLLLKPLIVDFPTVPITLLHCSYPYQREAAYLCWVYPNCYIDIGLAIPFLSQRGMVDVVRNLFEICPADKMLYSSDAHHIPELYYLGAKWARYTLKVVLQESISNGEITLNEAKEFSRKILRDNVIQLYHLEI
eukprot:gene15924-18930_t